MKITEFARKFSTAIQEITATVALFTAFASIWLTYSTLSQQKTHNELSVKPVMRIEVWDGSNEIWVKIKNRGLGPGRITSVQYSVRDISVKKKTLADVIESEVNIGEYIEFGSNPEDKFISADKEDVMVHFHCAALRTPDNCVEYLYFLRTVLKDTEIRLEYEDLYGNQFHASRQLKWFGRLLNDDNGGTAVSMPSDGGLSEPAGPTASSETAMASKTMHAHFDTYLLPENETKFMILEAANGNYVQFTAYPEDPSKLLIDLPVVALSNDQLPEAKMLFAEAERTYNAPNLSDEHAFRLVLPRNAAVLTELTEVVFTAIYGFKGVPKLTAKAIAGK